MMIEVRIIQYGDTSHQPNMGVKEAEVLVGSMMNDGWEIKSYQYDSHIDDNHGGGVFVMVRDVEPVVEADSGHYRDMCFLFELLSKDHIVGAIKPGYLWQLQLGIVDIARWLIAHGADNGSPFSDTLNAYITAHEKLTDGVDKSENLNVLRKHAEEVHAEYLAAQKDGE